MFDFYSSFIYINLHLFIYFPIYLFILFIYFFIYLLIYLFIIYWFFLLYLFAYLFIYLFIYSDIDLFMLLSVLLWLQLVKLTYAFVYIAMFISYCVYIECRGRVETNVVTLPHCCKYFGNKICLNSKLIGGLKMMGSKLQTCDRDWSKILEERQTKS